MAVALWAGSRVERRVSAACRAASAAYDAALAAFDHVFEPLDLPCRHNVCIAPPELLLGIQLIQRLLVSALCFLDLTIGSRNVGLRHDHRRVDFDQTPLGYLELGFLLGAVEPEDGRAFLNIVAHLDVNLAHAAVCFRQNRNAAEKRRHAGL